MAPSTSWVEQIAPGEEERLAAFAKALTTIQERLAPKYGPGRAFHRKGLLALRGTLAVSPDLPAELRQGLFARPGPFEVHVRLSNGSSRIQRNGEPDIRGFALSVRDVAGPGALGVPTTAQDFLLIQREVFGFRDVEPFVDLALAAVGGPWEIVKLMVRTHGLFRGLSEVRRLLASLRTPFSGFLTEPFFSTVPVAWGPFAVRIRLQPAGPVRPQPAPDLADEVLARLATGPSVHALQVQFFEDEARTPIEDASVRWDAPYVTVGTLTLPAQGRDEALTQAVEADGFDPWRALAEHRPLGHVMRARKHAYFASVQARK